MELSKYQKEIIDFFKNNPHDNIIVKALAGTGKSTLICLLTEETNTSDIYVAFNSSIAEEFSRKINNPKTKVKTLHSLGLAIMNSNLSESSSKGGIGSRNGSSGGATLDNFKIHKIIDELIYETFGKYDKFEHKIFIKDNYVQLYNLCRLTCTDMSSDSAVEKLVEDYNLFVDYSGNDFSSPLVSTMVTWLEQIDERSLEEFEANGIIDFTDMLYITYKKLSSGEWKVPYYNLYTNVYFDECQDASMLQLFLLKYIKRKGGRFVFVGDFHQCQPEGTKISLIDGKVKNIEDLKYGDRVIEYSTARGKFMSSEKMDRPRASSFVGVNSKGSPKTIFSVIDKQEFYVDKTITIKTKSGLSSTYTTNHNCYVKFNEENTQEAVCLYLMERWDGIFRIGKVHLYSSQSVLGIKQRARSEGFDRCWILDIYDNNTEAWVNEQKYSLKYQIPQVIFQSEKVNYTEEDINKIYDSVPNMRGRAVALLEEFNRDINYPIWTRNDIFNHTARTHCFLTQACNIVPKYMDALIFDKGNRTAYKSGKREGELRHIVATYDNIISVGVNYGMQKVIGITTDNYHNYVADGILTHNSIYSFAGADSQSFNKIPKLYAPIKEFDLPINYRCPTSHLAKVNRDFGIPIQPRPDAPVGSIKTIDKEEIKKYVHAGDLVISRKNKWLSDVILDLAIHGIPIYMEDKEMVEQIKKLVSSQKAASLYELKNKLEKIIKKYNVQLEKIVKKETEKAEEDTKKMIDVSDTNSRIDNINFIKSILSYYSSQPQNKYDKPDDFIRYIDVLLNTKMPSNCVRVCSVHKAKGLEAPQTFVLNEAKVCTDRRNCWEQNEQEKNLSYISITRAKENLFLVRETDV